MTMEVLYNRIYVTMEVIYLDYTFMINITHFLCMDLNNMWYFLKLAVTYW